MTPRYFALTFAMIAFGFTTSHRADAQHFDIFLARPAAGTTTIIGGADVDALMYDDVVRVFEAEMGSAGGGFLSLEPGVNHPNINDPGLTAYPATATALLPGDALRLVERDFTVAGNVDDLFYWNGVDPVSFAAAAANFRIDGGDPLGSVAGTGGAFDDHPFLVVDSDALPGIYLASVVGRVDGFNPSAPVYLVIGTEDLITAEFLGITQAGFDMLTDEQRDEALDEVIEAGVAYVEANVVPEPASFALLAIAVAGGTAIGRRRAKGLRNP
jgi:hypothetical protein